MYGLILQLFGACYKVLDKSGLSQNCHSHTLLTRGNSYRDLCKCMQVIRQQCTGVQSYDKKELLSLTISNALNKTEIYH